MIFLVVLLVAFVLYAWTSDVEPARHDEDENEDYDPHSLD